MYDHRTSGAPFRIVEAAPPVEIVPRVGIDVAALADALAEEQPAPFDRVLPGLPIRLANDAICTLIADLGCLAVRTGLHGGPATIGFGNEFACLARLGNVSWTLQERVRLVLAGVIDDYVPAAVYADFVGRLFTAVESDLNSRVRKHEAELISMGAPSAIDMVKRRLGVAT